MLIIDIVLSIIKYEIKGEKPSKNILQSINENNVKDVFQLLKKHELPHFLLDTIKLCENIKNQEIIKFLENEKLKSIYIRENLDYELETLCNFFENEGIDFVPLKGAVIKDFYKESYLRSSCDVDVLIKERDIEKAKQLLIDKLGYVFKFKGAHDLTFITKNNVTVELHYDLIEKDVKENINLPLNKVIETCKLKQGKTHYYEMQNETFYYYHLAHIVKHFLVGGSGIRPIIDLYLIRQNLKLNEEKLNALLKEGEIQTFAKNIELLSEVWFNNKEHTPLTKDIEEFIFKGGHFGNVETLVKVQQVKKGGKIKYLFKRIWLPYDDLKIQYPTLNNKKWLYPIYQIRRWGRLIFLGRLKRGVTEIKHTAKNDKKSIEKTKNLLKRLEL